MIYHILVRDEWERVKSGKFYTPAAFDQDGFIHLCEAAQFARVVSRYFLGRGDLVVLCVAPEALIAELHYENLLGGDELFPHLYGRLNLDAVREVIYFRSGQDQTTRTFSIESIRCRHFD